MKYNRKENHLEHHHDSGSIWVAFHNKGVGRWEKKLAYVTLNQNVRITCISFVKIYPDCVRTKSVIHM